MKEAAVLLRFLRHDRVGQRLGVSALVVAWLAIAWTSLTFAEVVRRRREADAEAVDELDDLY